MKKNLNPWAGITLSQEWGRLVRGTEERNHAAAYVTKSRTVCVGRTSQREIAQKNAWNPQKALEKKRSNTVLTFCGLEGSLPEAAMKNKF